MMRVTRILLVLLVAASALPGPGATQVVRSWTAQRPSQGWIGFWYNLSTAIVDGREQPVLVISEVAEGSPAAMADLRTGDTVTHMDGQPVSQEAFASLGQTLQPGDVVRMTVRRDGRAREVMVEASQRPTHLYLAPDPEEVRIHLETLSGNILRNIDSLKTNIAGLQLDTLPGGGISLRIVRVPGERGVEQEIGFQLHLSEPFFERSFTGGEVVYTVPEFTMPFEAFLVESQEATVLKEELTELRKQLTTVRREELARQRELAASTRGVLEETLREDRTIRDLRAREADLVTEQERVIQRLRQVSELEMQRQWAEMRSRQEDALIEAQRDQVRSRTELRSEAEAAADRARELYELSREEFKSPVIVGQSFILGAQLAPLNPELGEYFQVSEGVIVMQVMEGTPAFEAGLRGGDVIVRMAGEEVASLADLRFGLGATQGPLTIQVIRKGNPVELVIRR